VTAIAQIVKFVPRSEAATRPDFLDLVEAYCRLMTRRLKERADTSTQQDNTGE
jgi:hypothetical protein